MLRSSQWMAIMRFAEASQVFSGRDVPAEMVVALASDVSVDQCIECLQQVPVDSASHRAAAKALAALMSVSSPAVDVLLRALREPGTRGPTIRQIGQLPATALVDSEPLLQAVANCVADPDTGLATLAGKVLARTALGHPVRDNTAKAVKALQSVPAYADKDETYLLRAWEIVAHLAVDSADDALAPALPVLNALVASTFTDDALLTLNALQIVHVLCGIEAGARLCLACPGFTAKLARALDDALVGEDALRLCASLAVYDADVKAAFLANVAQRLSARSSRDALVAVETLARLMAAGSPVDAAMLARWQTRLGELVQTGAELDRVVALGALATALRPGAQPPPPPPPKAQREAAAEAVTVPPDTGAWLVVCLQSAHERVRAAALDAVRVLAMQRADWGLDAVLGNDRLVAQLHAMRDGEARDVVRAIAAMPRAASKDGALHDRAKRLTASSKPQLAEPMTLNL